MSAHDKSAIPADATAVSDITRAQKATRRWRGTGDIFSKAHLNFFVKRMLADDATTEHCAYNHPPYLPSPFLEKNWSSRAVSAHLIFNHVYTLRTILAEE